MNSTEFVIWLKGFVVASNNYNLTPQAWDTLKSELKKVDVESSNLGAQDLSDFTEEDEYLAPPPNDALVEAAKKYKEWLEELDKSDRPTWYTTTTNTKIPKK